VGAKGYSKVVLLDSQKASFEVSTPKVRGMRELKNLDCTVSLVKGQRRRGFLGSNNDFSFPPKV
jgi:hypothetical protein